MSPKTCVVIGASHAAVQLITSLRQEGWDGEIIVVGEESYLPYHRPPLSKAVLKGEKEIDDILLRPEPFYKQLQVNLKLGARVTNINRIDQSISLANGEIIGYRKLVICTGASPIILNLPGESLEGIGYLRTYSDIEILTQHVKSDGKAVVIGGGYIGLEAAAALCAQGMNVTVLEALDRVLQRVTTPELSQFYTDAHKRRGVCIVAGASVTGFVGNGKIEKVLCDKGIEYEADLVVIGVGVRPNVSLAENAGLAVDNGICVDEYSQTEDPNIFAIGDCTSFPCAATGTRLRLESVPNATEQAKSAAATICGSRKPYTAIPWFWSDQYDLKLQIAGLARDYDNIVIRGNMENEVFSAWYFKGNTLLAADCVNQPMDFMSARKAILKGINPPREKIADVNFDITQLAA